MKIEPDCCGTATRRRTGENGSLARNKSLKRACTVVAFASGLTFAAAASQACDVKLGAVGPMSGGAAAANVLASENVHVTMGPVGSPETTGKADYERYMKASPPDNPLRAVCAIAAEQLFRAVSNAGRCQDAERIAAELMAHRPESFDAGKAGWRGNSTCGVYEELAFPVGLGFIRRWEEPWRQAGGNSV